MILCGKHRGVRAGRPRKFGGREKNGRIKRASVSARDPMMLEQLYVLRQPHRRGDTDQLLESPLGRLVIRHKLAREYFDAATEYGGMVRCFYAAKMPAGAMTGIPQLPGDDRVGSGNGVSQEKAVWLEKELKRLETPLKALSRRGFSALRMLAVHEKEIAPQAEHVAIVVLCELGSLLRKVGKR